MDNLMEALKQSEKDGGSAQVVINDHLVNEITKGRYPKISTLSSSEQT